MSQPENHDKDHDENGDPNDKGGLDAHHVTTEDELRALAHPLRLRLLALLRADGPATASSLGARVGENSGVTSYHLRYLAERNFVEDAPELGNKRERWWQAAQRFTSWDSADFLESRPARAAELTIRREGMRYAREALDNWLIDRATWPREWVSAAVMSDALLQLSVDEMGSFAADFQGLLERYVAISDANETEERDDTERVLLVINGFPVGEFGQ